jgi:hypothetical protein
MAELILHGLVLSSKTEQSMALPTHCPNHSLITCNGVTALVSGAPVNVRSLSPDAVASLGLHHHAILQAYCDIGAVLPMRFGSVFTNEDAVYRHIAPQAGQMMKALHYLETHQEYTLRLTVSGDPLPMPQPARTGREFLTRGRNLRDLRQGLADRRMALARNLAETAEQIAVQVTAAGAPRPDRALDLVMLLPAGAVTHLSALAARVAPQARDLGLDLGLAGPWPAYSYLLPESEVCDGA